MLTAREMYGVVQTSNVIESRSIPHPARLDRESFMPSWKITQAQHGFARQARSASEKLPKFFAGMMAEKKWRTLSEEALRVSSAAWEWIRAFCARYKSMGHKLKVPWPISLLYIYNIYTIMRLLLKMFQVHN